MLKKVKDFLFSSSSGASLIAKNTTWLFIGEIVGRLVRFWIVIYSARVLGAGEYGVFSYALTLSAFASIFADIGISALITRETSKNPGRQQELFNIGIFAKLILIVLITTALLVISPLVGNVPGSLALIPLIIAMFFFDSLRDFVFSIYRAREKMYFEAGIKILMNVLITGAGFIALQYSQSAYAISVGYVIGSGITCLMALFTLSPLIKGFRLNHVNFVSLWQIFKLAWPIGLLQLLGAIMINTDMAMLGWWRSPEELGYYGAVQKIILLLYIIPSLFSSATFPAFSRFAISSTESFRRLFEKSVAISFGFALPMFAGIALLSGKIVTLLFGTEYLPGATALTLLSFTLLIVFPSTLFSNALFAFNKQKLFLWFVFVGVVLNAIGNYLLIPRFGIEGASYATIFSQLITNFFVWRALLKTLDFSIIPRLYKLFLSTIVMSFCVIFFMQLINQTYLLIILGVASYVLSLVILKEPLLKEMKELVFPKTARE
jgi:O-antigen/teichoic acid export membrane protein